MGFSVCSVVLLLMAAWNASAFWRMPCGAFPGAFRVDPIVSPGRLSEHPHVIHGSGGFGLRATFADLTSSCTTCEVEQDKSVYW